MIKKISLIIVSLITALSIAAPAGAFALYSVSGSQSAACAGLNAGSTTDSCKGGGTTLDNILQVIINLFSAIVGVIAVIMIIVAALKFITSGGDSAGVAAARSSLLWALAGLLVAALAQVLAHFVLGTANNQAAAASGTLLDPSHSYLNGVLSLWYK